MARKMTVSRKRTGKSLQGLPALIRFWDKVVQTDCGCWLWREGCARKSERNGGYPMFWDEATANHPQHAVAWAYKAIRKLEPPKKGSGRQLSHQPDVCTHMSHCCNPYHVENETIQENIDKVPVATKNRIMADARTHKKPVPKPTNTACGHLDKPHRAKHLCRSCYQASRYELNPGSKDKYRQTSNAYHNNRYKTDPVFRAKHLASSKASYYRRKQTASAEAS